MSEWEMFTVLTKADAHKDAPVVDAAQLRAERDAAIARGDTYRKRALALISDVRAWRASFHQSDDTCADYRAKVQDSDLWLEMMRKGVEALAQERDEKYRENNEVVACNLKLQRERDAALVRAEMAEGEVSSEKTLTTAINILRHKALDERDNAIARAERAEANAAVMREMALEEVDTVGATYCEDSVCAWCGKEATWDSKLYERIQEHAPDCSRQLALAPDAGRALLDVVKAAKAVCDYEQQNEFSCLSIPLSATIAGLRQKLKALEASR